MGRNELRYLYIGSIAIAAWTALSGGAFLALWNLGAFDPESAHEAGLELMILVGLALTGVMCLLCWIVALSNLRHAAVSVRAAAVSTALGAAASLTGGLAYPGATGLGFGVFLVSLLVLLVAGLGAAVRYIAKMKIRGRHG